MDHDSNEIVQDAVPSTEPFSQEGNHGANDSSGEDEIDEDATTVVKAINAASQLLRSINGPHPQSALRCSATPGSGKRSSRSASRTDKCSSNSPHRSTKLKLNGQPLSNAQLDAFLLIANGGMPIGADSANMVPGQPDDAIAATVQGVIDQLVAQNKHLIARGSETPSSALASPEHGDANSDDRIAALRKILSMKSLSCNTIIPSEQARATSKLYRELARATPPSGGINPARASAFGTTTRLHERVITDPNLYTGPYPMLPQHHSPPIHSPARQWELERVQIYGFPPQAGARLGVRNAQT